MRAWPSSRAVPFSQRFCCSLDIGGASRLALCSPVNALHPLYLLTAEYRGVDHDEPRLHVDGIFEPPALEIEDHRARFPACLTGMTSVRSRRRPELPDVDPRPALLLRTIRIRLRSRAG